VIAGDHPRLALFVEVDNRGPSHRGVKARCLLDEAKIKRRLGGPKTIRFKAVRRKAQLRYILFIN
jgi:hypothetical protein